MSVSVNWIIQENDEIIYAIITKIIIFSFEA